MRATTRIHRVAVAVALGVTATFVLRAEAAQAAPVELAATGARLAHPESAAIGPARRGVPPATDTSAKRERGKSERVPTGPRRRIQKAKSGAAGAPQSSAGGQYVPDQPWETEFFVQNTLPTRHYVIRLASFEPK